MNCKFKKMNTASNNQEQALLWTELAYIKEHSRICTDCEDAVLEMYAASAEQTILNLLNRSYESLIGEYGDIPAPIRHATLMLVDNFYQNRTPVGQANQAAVPYTFDVVLKPYKVL